MSIIDVELTGFTGSYARLNGFRTVVIEPADVIRCILTVGMVPNSPLFPFGSTSFLKNISLSAMALCVLDFGPQALSVTPLFRSLDGSEKGSFSYWLGMALLKFAAELEMNVGWLMHVDPLVRSGDAVLPLGSNVRGDLVGTDYPNFRWHVFESKGRSNRVPISVMDAAKLQAMQVQRVFGVAPATYCAGGVSLGTSPVSVLIEDPRPKTPNRGGSQGSTDSFWHLYYRCIIEFLRTHKAGVVSRMGIKYRMANAVGLSGVRVGIPEEIYSNPSRVLTIAETIMGLRRARSARSVGSKGTGFRSSVGLDGILVEGKQEAFTMK